MLGFVKHTLNVQYLPSLAGLQVIKNLQIKNFRGLSELNIKDISRVNLIGGCNNAGKTSILEALYLFHNRADTNMFLHLHGWRGIQSVEPNPESMWGSIFSFFEMTSDIEFIVETDKKEKIGLVFRVNKSYIQPLNSPLWGQAPQIKTNMTSTPPVALDIIYSPKYGNDRKKEIAHHWIESNTFGMHFDYKIPKKNEAVFMAATAHSNSLEDAIRFGIMDVAGEQIEIITFIKETIESRLINLTAVPALTGQSTLYAEFKGINRKIPISCMGDGMARLISIILTISTNKNGCVLIDEIENGIHYSVLPKIWLGIIAAAQKYNCQIFATTHSYECLEAAVNGIVPELRDEFRYIRLERNDDKLLSQTYLFEELSASIEHGWEVR